MPNPKHNKGFDSDGITYKSLLQFVKDAHSALKIAAVDAVFSAEQWAKYSQDPNSVIRETLEQAAESAKNWNDAAHYFEMIAEYLENDYKPSKGLKFNTRILGL